MILAKPWQQQNCSPCVVLVLQVQASPLLEAYVRLSQAVKQLQGQEQPCVGEMQQQVRRAHLLATKHQLAAVMGCNQQAARAALGPGEQLHK